MLGRTSRCLENRGRSPATRVARPRRPAVATKGSSSPKRQSTRQRGPGQGWWRRVLGSSAHSRLAKHQQSQGRFPEVRPDLAPAAGERMAACAPEWQPPLPYPRKFFACKLLFFRQNCLFADLQLWRTKNARLRPRPSCRRPDLVVAVWATVLPGSTRVQEPCPGTSRSRLGPTGFSARRSAAHTRLRRPFPSFASPGHTASVPACAPPRAP